MTELETDIVLSAIRRGEDSLPRLRAATGLEYAKLHGLVYKLEFDFRSIRRTETPDGFDRFALANSEKTSGAPPATTVQAVPPSAYAQTKAGNHARAVTLIQRDAPYCVACRGFCVFDGLDLEGRVHWRCKPCDITFEGSLMGRIEPEPKIPEMRDRVPLGPEEEAAIENMRQGIGRSELGHEEESVLDEMRGGELSEDEARISEEIDRELAVDDEEDEPDLGPCNRCGAPTPAEIRHRRVGKCQDCYKVYLKDRREQNKIARQGIVDAPPEICGCGRTLPHIGRCSARRDPNRASKEKQPRGRPRAEVDLQGLENLLADPDLTIQKVGEKVGIDRNTIYQRKDADPEFRAAYDRGMERREQAIARGKSEIITKPITSNGNGAVSDPANKISAIPTNEAVAAFPLLNEEPKTRNANPERAKDLRDKVAKPAQIMQRIIPSAQVQVMGGLKLHEQVEVRVSEIAQWPADRITEFFEALTKVIEIPQRPFVPKEIKPAWSRDFENDDDAPGLTMLYLISMLHYNMEPHEQEAVWTLVMYLKRMEAAKEMKATA